jgi:hypothetical protein
MKNIILHLKSLTNDKDVGKHMTLEIQVLVWDRHKNVAG